MGIASITGAHPKFLLGGIGCGELFLLLLNLVL